MANVAGHYARQIGLFEALSVTNLNKDERDAGNSLGFRAIASTIGDGVFINAAGGFVSPLLDDYYNFKNVLYHEKRHLFLDHGNIRISYLDHASVYVHQLDDPLFLKTTKDYKKTITNGIVHYLSLAANDELNQPFTDLDKIQNVVDELNKKSKTTGYVFNFQIDTHSSPDPKHTTILITKKLINK